ncbi:MAG: hypothetical protein LBS40_04505 [Burkholderiales bacterium]|jgi:hypothetical protein|nr:hypothetical protein [Burkholderiales bacterium]
MFLIFSFYDIRVWENIFPQRPFPEELFIAGKKYKGDEFSDDVERIFWRKQWRDVALNDWDYIGKSRFIYTEFMHPKAFHYYVPLLLYEALPGKDNLDLYDAVRALLPYKDDKGWWWLEYFSSFTREQRFFINKYIYGLNEIISDCNWEMYSTKKLILIAINKYWYID